MTSRGGIYGNRFGDGSPVGDVTRQSSGCVYCDMGLPVFEGQRIPEDYHRRAVTGDRVPCTRKS